MNIRGSSKLLLQLLVYARVVLIVARYTFQCKGFGSNPDSCSIICESSDNWMYHIGYPGRNCKFESYLLLFFMQVTQLVRVPACQVGGRRFNSLLLLKTLRNYLLKHFFEFGQFRLKHTAKSVEIYDYGAFIRL